MRFYSNSADLSFSTLVEEIRVIDGHTWLALKESEFYPGGGGQLHDRGTIGGHTLREVMEYDGKVYHRVDRAEDFFSGMRVLASVDRDYRMEVSRQHTGQHLLSAVLENDWQIKTVSFHMSEGYSTIDVDRPIHEDIMDAVLEKVNDLILMGIEVEKHYTSSTELEKLGLRKLIEAEGEIQLIKIGDLDHSGCCGTHVDNTRDLIMLVVRKIEGYKGGSRITFSFGKTARNYLFEIQKAFEDIRGVFGVHESELPFQVRLLMEKEEEERKKVTEIREKLADLMVSTLDDESPVLYMELDEEEELIKLLAEKLLFIGRRGILIDMREKRMYGFGEGNGINLGKIFKDNKPTKIRGGGGPKSFQAVSDDMEDLTKFGKEFVSIMEETYSL